MTGCLNCGNPSPWHKQIQEGWEMCEQCGLQGGGSVVPDAYLPRTGMVFQNLCDRMGRPYEIRSKRHKKEVMDRLGVSEAGDRVQGSNTTNTSWIDGTRAWRKRQFDKDRPVIRETYKAWKEKYHA